MENSKDFLANYEKLRRQTFDAYEIAYLNTAAHLSKEEGVTSAEIIKEFDHTLLDKALELVLELEYQVRANKGEWTRPKLLAEHDHAYKYDDGLWYWPHDCGKSACPSCGQQSSPIYWNGPYAYMCCHDCRVAWNLPFTCGKSLVAENEQKQVPDEALLNKIGTYTSADAIYRKSSIKNIWLDMNIREKLNNIKNRREQEHKAFMKCCGCYEEDTVKKEQQGADHKPDTDLDFDLFSTQDK